MSLYGTFYLMPLFLGFVRHHNALEIGFITLATGVAQLITAPIAILLERYTPVKYISLFGFVILLVGLWLSSAQTSATDFNEMFWPQIIRGIGFMLCLIAPTRIALDGLNSNLISDGSAIFNLARNLGGAIGLALIDTVIFGRGPEIAQSLSDRLKSGDQSAASEIGIPIDLFENAIKTGITPLVESFLNSAIEKTSFFQATNEAWTFLAGITLLGVIISITARSEKYQSEFKLN